MPESHTTSETRETRISRLPNMGAISVRRDLCPRLDPDYRASQDLEWKIRLLQDGPTVSFVESADFIYRHHSGARNLNGAQERVIAQRRLIEQHEEYFVHHKDEHAFRLYRTGLVHYRMGQRSSAALAAIESMRIRPNTNAAELMARVILPPSWTLAAIKRASPRRARGINE